MQFNRSLFGKLAAVAGLALAAAGSAHAGGHVSIGVNLGGPAYVSAPPVVVAPQPVYVQPAPVYQQPGVVYSQPQVVYTQPQVVYTQPVYPAGYYYRPAPVVLGFGYSNGWGHHHHGHWR